MTRLDQYLSKKEQCRLGFPVLGGVELAKEPYEG